MYFPSTCTNHNNVIKLALPLQMTRITINNDNSTVAAWPTQTADTSIQHSRAFQNVWIKFFGGRRRENSSINLFISRQGKQNVLQPIFHTFPLARRYDWGYDGLVEKSPSINLYLSTWDLNWSLHFSFFDGIALSSIRKFEIVWCWCNSWWKRVQQVQSFNIIISTFAKEGQWFRFTYRRLPCHTQYTDMIILIIIITNN